MSRPQTLKLAVALALLGAAGAFLYRHLSAGDGLSDRAYFYDLSAKKLFTAPRAFVPPIKGVDNDDLDGVSAVVISPSGDPADKKNRRIAYLEKYSPELKRDLEEAQRTGQAAQISRSAAQGLRFVRREHETNWHSLTSDEGNRIISEWANPGPDGAVPAVCVP